MLKAKGLSIDQAFTVSKDGTLPKDLVEVVRVMLAAAKPHAHGHAHEGSEEELQDELDALEQLGGMLDDRIVAIEDAQKEVSGEAREEVRLMCHAYVSGASTSSSPTAATDSLRSKNNTRGRTWQDLGSH